MRGPLPHVRGMGTLTSSFQDSGLRPEPTALVSTRHTSQASSTHSQPRKGVSVDPLPRSHKRRISLQLCHTWDMVSETNLLGAPNGDEDIEGPSGNSFRHVPSQPSSRSRGTARGQGVTGMYTRVSACQFGGMEVLGHVSSGDHTGRGHNWGLPIGTLKTSVGHPENCPWASCRSLP